MSRHPCPSSNILRHPARAALWSTLSAATLGLFCSMAGAEETPDQVVVAYADLNLSSQPDAEKLYKRLQRASQHVCREYEGRNPAKARLRHQCYGQALTNAVANVNHTMVTALHADKNVRLAQGKASNQPRS